MQPAPTVLFFSPANRPLNEPIRSWLEDQGYPIVPLTEAGQVETWARHRLPVLVLVDADGRPDECDKLCRALKKDPYTGAIPVAIISSRHARELVAGWFEAGADEVITPLFEPAEQRGRLGVLIQRTERSLAVHPSTRLPGTIEIEREFKRRMERQERFAVCYADIDHFKEFNDRYSYYDGDRVIYLLSRILRDVVNGLCPENGFVGHIGGDDFIFVIEPRDVPAVCSEILEVFDTLIPYQYSPQDRGAGYFFGKDRRGHLHRVPLMTLSIGVVTNEQRRFQHPAQISELATEMKSYAKTLPGSVFVVDRRRDPGMAEDRAAASREARG